MAGKTNDFYYKDGAIKPELVTTLAEQAADSFVPRQQFSPDGRPKNRNKMNAAQLRRFYGDVKNLEMRWKNSSSSKGEESRKQAFLEILPMIKLLKAKTAYSQMRDLVPQAFKDWMWENVDRINTEEDFKAFLLFFEAVVGFCYGNGLKD